MHVVTMLASGISRIPSFQQNQKKMLLPWINTPVPTNRIYYDLCILKYFVNIIDINNNMTHNLSSLLTDYPNVDILAMGFPANWKNEPVWKIL